ncbi:MAG: ribose-phosphate pyrophosphokinase [Bacillota bacterium]|nr:ribose-phosphate pyrophosphokinase [Bacillota bacterium]
MVASDGRLKVFSGNANPDLAKEICEQTGIHLGEISVSAFSDGEIKVIIKENVRGDDVFIVQPTSTPVNNNLMELLIIIDAMKRSSAKRITAVVPYYGYGRQDRKTRGREPITAKLVANLIDVAGADRVLTMDLHASQIQGFFDLPVDHLTAMPILAQYFAKKQIPEVIVIAPDVGGVTRARMMAELIAAPIAIVDKRRPEPNVSEALHIIGEIDGKTAIIVDDMIDTAGSVSEISRVLLDHGAAAVYACCSHPVLSGPAIDRLNDSAIKEIIVTNTVPLPQGCSCPKIKVLSVAPILGEAIARIHMDMSVSELFR